NEFDPGNFQNKNYWRSCGEVSTYYSITSLFLTQILFLNIVYYSCLIIHPSSQLTSTNKVISHTARLAQITRYLTVT
ncbi:hypothetical protein L9F63_003835, partial [Diploptera punctata]